MKQLRKSDLKEGEIYKQLQFDYIFLYDKNETYYSFNDGTAICAYAPRYCKRWSGNSFIAPMVETTPEEKHWLKECIKADKFVSYEEAMKTFIPEFVLPEIWWVRITQENLEDVCKFLGFQPSEGVIGYIAGMVKKYNTGKIEKGWNSTPTTIYGSTFGNEITTEQFRKYVLKKEPLVFEEPKDTVLQLNQIRGKGTTIVQVQCSEGGIYKIGDKITVFDKTSPNKGKPFTIQGFRWNNAKTKLYAVTELHTPNGIGLDKIELYIQPKVKFVLPKKWCVKDVKEVKEFFENYNYGNYSCRNNAYLHYPKIVYYCYFKEIQKDYTEITLEQFKKYVLNEKV